MARLCERLGWRGTQGFARLQGTPELTIRDFLAIAAMEEELQTAHGS